MEGIHQSRGALEVYKEFECARCEQQVLAAVYERIVPEFRVAIGSDHATTNIDYESAQTEATSPRRIATGG